MFLRCVAVVIAVVEMLKFTLRRICVIFVFGLASDFKQDDYLGT